MHRNLRLENMLLDGNFFQPLLKISGFAYSKAPDLDSGKNPLSKLSSSGEHEGVCDPCCMSAADVAACAAPKTLATGNPAYTPPEMLMAVRNEGASYDGDSFRLPPHTMQTPVIDACYLVPSIYAGRGVDVWSAGVILFNMVTGQLPFQVPYAPDSLVAACLSLLGRDPASD